METYKKKKRRGDESFVYYIGSGYENDPISLFAAQIVIHAIQDWRELVKAKAWLDKPNARCNFNELRLFFKGEWCDFLLQNFAVDPKRILEMLEAELAAAQEKEERKWKLRQS